MSELVYPTRLLKCHERINLADPFSIYTRHHVEILKDLTPMFVEDAPELGAWDTEGTGLHLKKDYPFLIGIGWRVKGQNKGRAVTFPPTHENIMTFLSWGRRLKQFWFWNGKFDLHMMLNIGYEVKLPNLCEGMVLARLTTEAKSVRHGGDKMALKDFAKNYIYPSANESDKVLGGVIKKAQDLHRKELLLALKQFKYTKKALNEILNDVLKDENDLPEQIREVYLEWKKMYPLTAIGEKDYHAGYKFDPQTMIHYLQDDLILTIESVMYALPVLVGRDQVEIMKQENKRIWKLLSVERVGLLLDKKYLEQSKVRVRDYIQKKRKTLHNLAGEVVGCSQNKRIAQILKDKWSVPLPDDKSNEAVLNDIIEGRFGEMPDETKQFCRMVMDLRSLEKWYSTYIIRLMNISEHDGRMYTQLNPASAVSGRFTSDAQQFPRDPLKDDEGNELVYPRRAIVVPEGYTMVLIDFSQQELRVQADYTIDVMGGDFNLCNAYIPFKCKHYITGEEYDFRTPEARARWKELKPEALPQSLDENLKQGFSVWITPEGKPWVPTDVHSQTGHALLIELGYTCIEKFKHYEANEATIRFFGDIPVWKKVRSLAKQFNFMANYGGSKNSAMTQMKLPEVVAEKLVRAYYVAFPGVKQYQKAIMNTHARVDRGYIQNRYGRRYYLFEMTGTYRLANYGVQGTGADQTKTTMDSLYDYLENTQSMMLLTVHDEVIFLVKDGEEHIVPELQAIMEDHPWSKIPFVAEVSWTKTSWADKKGWSEYPCKELLSA